MEQITAREPAWLAAQPVDPLEAGALHPGRRAVYRSRSERDCRPAANEPRPRQAAGEPGDQLLLLREPQADEDYARLHRSELVAQPFDIGGRGVEAGGWRVCA